MTDRKKSHLSFTAIPTGRVAFLLSCAMALALILRNAETAISSMHKALALCYSTVIPSLFPFMVLSELIIRSGAASLLSKLLSPLCRFLFGIRGEGASAVLLGIVGGFPVGARTAAALYHADRIDERELSRLLCFCNLPSSAFVVSAVGISLFGSRAIGSLLYAITLLSALLIGILLQFFSKPFRGGKDHANKTGAPSARKGTAPDKPSSVASFCDAVADSARAMLTVCAFIVFFATLVGCLEQACAKAHLPNTLAAPIFAFFELTGGVSRASAVGGYQGMLLCAAALGWSGLSVHFQIMSICEGCPISYRPYFAAKAAHALLNVLLLQVTLLCFSPSFPKDDSAATATLGVSPIAVSVCAAMLCFGTAVLIGRFFQKKFQKKIAKKRGLRP